MLSVELVRITSLREKADSDRACKLFLLSFSEVKLN